MDTDECLGNQYMTSIIINDETMSPFHDIDVDLIPPKQAPTCKSQNVPISEGPSTFGSPFRKHKENNEGSVVWDLLQKKMVVIQVNPLLNVTILASSSIATLNGVGHLLLCTTYMFQVPI